MQYKPYKRRIGHRVACAYQYYGYGGQEMRIRMQYQSQSRRRHAIYSVCRVYELPGDAWL